MNYDKSVQLKNALLIGVQVKHFSSSEYVSFLTIKRTITVFLQKLDDAAQQLINDYNAESQVVAIDENNLLKSDDVTFFDKIKAIRSEELDIQLTFIEKAETFKAVFENCPLESQELLFPLLLKS